MRKISNKIISGLLVLSIEAFGLTGVVQGIDLHMKRQVSQM